MTSGEFFSRGKFLLSGEYLVLHGARALAVPLKMGQKMVVAELGEPDILRWETFVEDKLWFSSAFQLRDMEILDASDEKTAHFIQRLLKTAGKLEPGLHLRKPGYSVKNYIEFDIRWGLGSSSSLLSNLAYWLDINPFTLYLGLYNGSGYDVFCSRAEKPILFQLKEGRPIVHESAFKPSFSNQLYFVYSGRKQNSQESVRKFRAQNLMDDLLIREISDLTDSMLKSTSLEDFSRLMRLHESILSSVLGIRVVKDELFPDFQGEIKSLGAWGGDFLMAASEMTEEEVRNYFKKKNLQVIFNWNEIVL